MKYEFAIRTVSEANQREHWATKLKRKQRQQRDFSMTWRVMRGRVALPAVITFTRYGRAMDNDNLAGAFKHIRDQLAKELGIDDGDRRIEWRYCQAPGGRTDRFTVTVEEVQR